MYVAFFSDIAYVSFALDFLIVALCVTLFVGISRVSYKMQILSVINVMVLINLALISMQIHQLTD